MILSRCWCTLLWVSVTPGFTPWRSLKGQLSQRHQMCGVMERGAFCKASDKPRSQSMVGSGVISGCTRGRNPSLAHCIVFLFTRACSLGSPTRADWGRLETGRREVGYRKSTYRSACLSTCSSLGFNWGGGHSLMSDFKSYSGTFAKYQGRIRTFKFSGWFFFLFVCLFFELRSHNLHMRTQTGTD